MAAATEPIQGGIPFWRRVMAATIVAMPVALLYNLLLGRFGGGFTHGAVQG